MSEAAGVNSAGGSFGLSFGLAFAGAIMLASLSLVFTHKADSSTVLTPAQQEQVADTLEENAEVMTNTHLEELLAGQPPAVQEEIIAHQHGCAADRPADRAADPAARRTARTPQRRPHDTTPGSGAFRCRRSSARRLAWSRRDRACGRPHRPSCSP